MLYTAQLLHRKCVESIQEVCSGLDEGWMQTGDVGAAACPLQCRMRGHRDETRKEKKEREEKGMSILIGRWGSK